MSEAASRYRYKNIIALLALAVLGMAAIFSAELFTTERAKYALTGLGDAILIGGILGLLFEILLRSDMVAMIQEGHQETTKAIKDMRAGNEKDRFILEACNALGMERLFTSDRDFVFSHTIIETQQLTIIMNDGRTWFSVHEFDFENRLQQPDKATRVYLVHPESDYLVVLARKVDSTVESLKQKINETIKILSKHHSKQHTLEIYGHFLPSSYSLVLSERDAWQIPYLIGRKPECIPMFQFRKRDDQVAYASIERDVKIIRAQSAMLYPKLDPLPQNQHQMVASG